MLRTPRREEMREAEYWEVYKGKTVRCNLCPHRCVIAEGKAGICGVRWNLGGKLYTEIYGKVTALSVDPIEKKPLYHFLPGRGILSVSSYGCNFRCLHCQNWELSQEYRKMIRPIYLSPEELLKKALNARDSVGVAFTYNEPLIWFEYLKEVMPLLRERGQHTVLVTNGFINPEPLSELLPHLSAANIDVKGFTEEFYRKIVVGKLQPVLETAKRMHSAGVHVELTYLVIPTLNDDPAQYRGFINWVLNELGDRIPV
ncbi:MAG: AmmeMemoRadiSam system radical SAM enzyme, partial [Thermoplasmata archaeon]|nr:AmmeMemoRadiSam system radical SAM enzyme [Thermoplasmata archaeon]